LQGAEGELCPAIAADGQMHRPGQVKIGAIPGVGRDDLPTADDLACGWPAHAPAPVGAERDRARPIGVRLD